MKYLFILILSLGGCSFDAPAKCPEPTYIGLEEPFDEYERHIVNATKIKCSFLYSKCLKKLTRTGHRSWHAICGGKL